MNLDATQQVFMVFYAIFWGAINGVQPRWKAFQLPLCFRVSEVTRRTLLSFGLLTLFPLIFFSYVMLSLNGRPIDNTNSQIAVFIKLAVHGVIPAFAIFGFYRLWLGVIELGPSYFYKSNPAHLKEKYRHIEPTYRLKYEDKECKTPVVDLGSDSGFCNIVWALLYIVVAGVAPRL